MNYNKRQIIKDFFSTLESDQQQDWLKTRRACDASLYYFIKDIGGSVRKAGGDVSPKIHKLIFQWWQNPTINRKFAYLPRAWRKTTCLTEWGNIREYLLNNEIRILIPSEKMDTASTWLRWMEAQILTNRRLRWLYPELTVIDRAYTKRYTWSGDRFLMPRMGVYPEATVSCVGVRGASQGGHFDIISPDDMVGEKGMESPSVLEDAMRWFDNIDELLVEPDRSKPHPSIIHGTSTHWANGDFGHYVQEKYTEYEWRIVPALNDPDLIDRGNIHYIQNPDADPGESNWPEVWSTKHYIDMKANPEKESVFYAQHQNNPRQSGLLNKFDRKWLRYFRFEDLPTGRHVICETDEGKDGEKFALREMPIYGAIDPAGFGEIKGVKRGARSVILVGGQPRNSVKKFVLFVKAKRWKMPSDFYVDLFNANDDFRPRAWNIDNVGAGLFMYASILEERSKRHKTMPLFPFEVNVKKDSKDDDIQSLIPPMENGEIYIHRNMHDLIQEVVGYPNSMTKDIVDMMGKLNKHRWSRHERVKEIDPLVQFGFRKKPDDEDRNSGQSEITGY